MAGAFAFSRMTSNALVPGGANECAKRRGSGGARTRCNTSAGAPGIIACDHLGATGGGGGRGGVGGTRTACAA
jgi:hypothetical protein